jgi:hypothetical protein
VGPGRAGAQRAVCGFAACSACPLRAPRAAGAQAGAPAAGQQKLLPGAAGRCARCLLLGGSGRGRPLTPTPAPTPSSLPAHLCPSPRNPCRPGPCPPCCASKAGQSPGGSPEQTPAPSPARLWQHPLRRQVPRARASPRSPPWRGEGHGTCSGAAASACGGESGGQRARGCAWPAAPPTALDGAQRHPGREEGVGVEGGHAQVAVPVGLAESRLLQKHAVLQRGEERAGPTLPRATGRRSRHARPSGAWPLRTLAAAALGRTSHTRAANT